MNEKGFWNGWVKRLLHTPPDSVAWKIEDKFRMGLPDVLVCLQGRAMLLELKYLPDFPKRASTQVRTNLTGPQRQHLVTWLRAGGEAALVMGIGKEILVLDPLTCPDRFRADELFLEQPYLWGRFNRRELRKWLQLKVLRPIPQRHFL